MYLLFVFMFLKKYYIIPLLKLFLIISYIFLSGFIEV